MNPRHTALQCFVAVARHHGLDLSAERLAHEHALEEAEPKTTKLLRIVQDVSVRSGPLFPVESGALTMVSTTNGSGHYEAREP